MSRAQQEARQAQQARVRAMDRACVERLREQPALPAAAHCATPGCANPADCGSRCFDCTLNALGGE